MVSSLGVWMNGQLVGHWTVQRQASTFTYEDGWLRSDKVRSLSLSLPVTPSKVVKGAAVDHYFDNLLPDNEQVRERIGRHFRTRDASPFALLEAIGRDCVGAVQLLPEGVEPQGWDRIDCDPLSDDEVARLLDAVPSEKVLGMSEDDESYRISIAGAQEKTALLKHRGRWSRPHGATPTTHILKLPLGLVGGSRRVDLSDSVENEWVCSEIVRELGLPIARAEVARFVHRKVLVVERFDREWMDKGKWIARLPQEDFCQALGYPPWLKYEKDGGPGMKGCLDLLDGSTDAQTDRLAFQLTQLTFWLLAATDGHAKNYSIFLRPRDAYTMTPLYDVLSIWPYIGDAPNRFRWRNAGLAMAIRSKNAHYTLHTIQPRHWQAMAMKNGGSAVWQAMVALVDQVDTALQDVEGRLPRDFPEHTWQTIRAGTQSQAKRFRQGVSTDNDPW